MEEKITIYGFVIELCTTKRVKNKPHLLNMKFERTMSRNSPFYSGSEYLLIETKKCSGHTNTHL